MKFHDLAIIVLDIHTSQDARWLVCNMEKHDHSIYGQHKVHILQLIREATISRLVELEEHRLAKSLMAVMELE